MPGASPAGHKLEDLSARILATDPSDQQQVAALRARLEDVGHTLDAGSPPAELLKMGLAALPPASSPAGPSAPDVGTALNLIASALGAAAAHLNQSDADSLARIATVATALRSLRNQQVLHPASAAPRPPSTAPAHPRRSESAPVAARIHTPPPMDADPELIQEFVAESCDRIAAAEAALLALESDPDNTELLNSALGAFHTIKGASGFLGQARMQQLAHLSEDLLIRGREGEVSIAGENAGVALRACDTLRAMIVALGKAESADAVAGLDELLESLTRAQTNSAAPPEPVQFSEPVYDSESSAAPAPSALEKPAERSAPDPAPAAAPTPAPAAREIETSVHVRTDRLDRLIEMVGELMIAHGSVGQDIRSDRHDNARLEQSLARTGKMVRELQDLAMSLRMVPLRSTFQNLARLVRDVARKSGKSVEFHTSGEQTEIDRNMVEVIASPLMHMINNAVDHGIEPTGERTQQGKPSAGQVHVRAYHSAGHVVIELRDDGKGLDREKIVRKAVDAGLVEPGRELPEAEAFALIFHPGLSTADRITDISGRGIGMDVVKRSVESLHGKIDVHSVLGQGTTFTLHLPLTMAIADVMLIGVNAQRYLMPTSAIVRAFRPDATAVSTVAGRGEMVTFAGEVLPLFRLHRLFNVAGAKTDPAQAVLVIITGQGRRCALLVDELIAQQQVVIKSLGRNLPHLRGVAGGAILHDGTVGLILDAGGLLDIAHGRSVAA